MIWKIHRPCAPIFAVVILSAACAGESEEGPPPVLRDSAGIRIVETDAPVWTDGTRWRVGDEPSLQIGDGAAGDPQRQFAHIAGVHRLPSGVIAVVDAWAPAVIFFDSVGGLLGRTGRQGTGPGEFPPRATSSSFVCGTDTVYVVVQRNIAVYAPPGAYVRTFSLDPPAHIRACAGDRLVAQRTHTEQRTVPGVYTDSVVLVRYDGTGSMRAVIDSLPGQERSWMTGPEGAGYSLLTFGRTLEVAASMERLATGFGDAFEIEIRDTAGTVSRLYRIAGLDAPISQAEIDRFRDYVFDPWRGNEDERARLEAQLAAAQGRTRPAFAELRFDPAGNLWARRYDHLDAVEFYDYSSFIRSAARPTLQEPRRWAVLDPDGHYLGEVETPRDFVVHGIGDDWIIGVWRDELDIPYVRQYPLIKPPALMTGRQPRGVP